MAVALPNPLVSALGRTVTLTRPGAPRLRPRSRLVRRGRVWRGVRRRHAQEPEAHVARQVEDQEDPYVGRGAPEPEPRLTKEPGHLVSERSPVSSARVSSGRRRRGTGAPPAASRSSEEPAAWWRAGHLGLASSGPMLRTTSTGHGACCNTYRLTDPSRARVRTPAPLEPTRTTSKGSLPATSQIVSPGSPCSTRTVASIPRASTVASAQARPVPRSRPHGRHLRHDRDDRDLGVGGQQRQAASRRGDGDVRSIGGEQDRRHRDLLAASASPHASTGVDTQDLFAIRLAQDRSDDARLLDGGDAGASSIQLAIDGHDVVLKERTSGHLGVPALAVPVRSRTRSCPPDTTITRHSCDDHVSLRRRSPACVCEGSDGG